MPRRTIYLSDDLTAAINAANVVNVSAICQSALWAAINQQRSPQGDSLPPDMVPNLILTRVPRDLVTPVVRLHSTLGVERAVLVYELAQAVVDRHRDEHQH
jgi:hypothetical protein